MNKSFFYLITVLVTCLFSGVFAEVKADCTIHYYHSFSTNDDLTLTGDDPEFPFINWTRPDADEIAVYDDNTAELLYHLIGAIPRSIQYGDYSQPGTEKGEYVEYDDAPPLELNHLYRIEVREAESPGDISGVVITGITCEVEEEGFILENTGTGNVYVNGVLVPQCSQSLWEPDRDVPMAPLGCIFPIGNNDELLARVASRFRAKYIDSEVDAAISLIEMIIPPDALDENLYGMLLLTIIELGRIPDTSQDLYDSYSPSAVGGSYRINLELQLGQGRFNPVHADLVLDIETDTAKVSSVAINDFAVGHDPDTTLTVGACYEGSVTIDPTNPALSPVTLMKGQQVKVWSDRIGPITNIGQVNSAPILLLLDDGAK